MALATCFRLCTLVPFDLPSTILLDKKRSLHLKNTRLYLAKLNISSHSFKKTLVRSYWIRSHID